MFAVIMTAPLKLVRVYRDLAEMQDDIATDPLHPYLGEFLIYIAG